MTDNPAAEFAKLVDVVAQLRGENGCPWDKKQTHESLRRYVIEETYEVVDAIDQGSESKLKEELGDLLLQALLHAQIGKEHGTFDISDVWPSSYSANTNEILWGAKAAARMPWIAGVIRLASYECGMDQPTYSPVQQIVERSGTLFFSFQELDSTKPAGSVKIRVETIAHYLQRYAAEIIERKKAASPPGCPLLKSP